MYILYMHIYVRAQISASVFIYVGMYVHIISATILEIEVTFV